MIGKNIGQKVLKKIRDKKVKPKPRWEFLLKNYSIWSAGIIALLIGSLAMSVIIHMIRNNDWDVYEYINDSLSGFIFVTLPYFWLIFLGIFIFVVYYNFKHTKTGYRYKLPVIIIVAILVSAVLGGLFYNIGLGQAIDEVLGNRVSFYQKFLNQRHRMWARPGQGLLAGMVIATSSSDNFYLRDLGSKEWHVLGEGAIMTESVLISPGERLKIIGVILPQDEFKAKIIGPFMRPDIAPWSQHFPFIKDRMPQPLPPPPLFR